VEFSFEALEEAATSFRRIESFLERAAPHVGGWMTNLPAGFVEAMDDDLGTPAAVAVIHETVREGNRLLANGPSDELSSVYGQVVLMLDVLGLTPRDFDTGGADDALKSVVDALVQGLLEERAKARAEKDWERADAIRDQLKAAGIEIEDTPEGPKWAVDTASLRSTGGA
jgi:cysteinyl-tRNA synthetase